MMLAVMTNFANRKTASIVSAAHAYQASKALEEPQAVLASPTPIRNTNKAHAVAAAKAAVAVAKAAQHVAEAAYAALEAEHADSDNAD